MAKNYVGSGRVFTITAEGPLRSGQPIRVRGVNGVALIDADASQPCTVQCEGIFTLELEGVTAGDVVSIDPETNKLYMFETIALARAAGCTEFGRAMSGADALNKFQCRIQQNFDR